MILDGVTPKSSRARLALAALMLALPGLAAGPQVSAQEQPACPAEAAGAERLMLVLGSGPDATSAKVQLFEKHDGRWQPGGGPMAASLGGGGIGWSWTAKSYASPGEPVKTEGDKRSPAGFFPLGKPFGLSARSIPGHVTLRPAEHYCVDDPHSPHYNTVVPKASAGGASGEDMASIPLYRRGLFVDYPTSREAKGGSCIFVHVWRGKNAGTAGCVALAESDVTALQSWSQAKPAIIGILPKNAWERLRACFPGL
jgi:L,D-peptidoglycan transpeptidase YkuD (ErfK/YbiS/YcfS/YnhG family)